jgi:hypothetical protein
LLFQRCGERARFIGLTLQVVAQDARDVRQDLERDPRIAALHTHEEPAFGAPGVMRPIFPPVTSVNRFPSGPVVIPPGGSLTSGS